MRTLHSLICFLTLLLICLNSVAAERYAVVPRQDKPPAPAPTPSTTDAPTTAQNSGSNTPSATNTPSSTSGGKSDSASTTATNQPSSFASESDSQSGSQTTSATSSTASSITSQASSTRTTQAAGSMATTALNGQSASLANGTASPNPNALPVQPVITPGLSVAGVLLLILGGVYTLIGIKNKWLHIFLSTAFLASLAVFVLIIYVMNPPISNAVQGAYLVAVVITGLIFGALSIVFTEVTEGLGCLLGGFCLAMWFLVLKPGGLVPNTTGRIILVLAFTLGIFALSFTHYTRPYGLIGGISFAGATIVILGIDCFSRAGLKEFWLYVWDLNDNIFPLNTNTYPHTRGIRVEIAGIVLLALLGVISQMKLWKIVKERREKRAAERAVGERNLEQEDAEVGRRVEKDNNRERAEWEAVYGDKDKAEEYKADSGIGDEPDSPKKDGASIVGTRELSASPGDNIEMAELGAAKQSGLGVNSKRGSRGQDGGGVTIRVARDEDAIRELDEQGNPLPHEQENLSPRASIRNSRQTIASIESTGATTAGAVRGETKAKRDSERSSLPPPPAPFILPFSVPHSEHVKDGDGSSIATFADSDHAQPVVNTARSSKRFSDRSAFKRFSNRSVQESRHVSTSSEALVVPHVEDDQESSVAATVDDYTEDADSDAGLGSKNWPLPPKIGEIAGLDVPTPTSQRFSNQSSFDGQDSKEQSTRPTSMTIGGGELKERDMAETPRLPASIINFKDAGIAEPSAGLSRAGSKKSRAVSLTQSTIPDTWFKSKKSVKDGEKQNNEAVDSALQTPPVETLRREKSSKSLKSAAASETGKSRHSRQSFAESLNEQFPARLSKVVMTYRTNEWAKHLGHAEKPEVEELQVADSPAESDHDDKDKEVAAPVIIEQLQQTADNALPPPAPPSISQMSGYSANTAPPQLTRSESNLSKTSKQVQLNNRFSTANGFYNQPPLSRSASQISISHPNESLTNLHQSASMPLPAQPPPVSTRGFRSSSTQLLNQTVVESPIEDIDPDDVPLAHPYSRSGSFSRLSTTSLPQNTLMSRRDTLIRNKYTSGNLGSILPTQHENPFLTASPAPGSARSSVIGVGDSASAYQSRMGMLAAATSDDDLPLSQRKELIRAASGAGSSSSPPLPLSLSPSASTSLLGTTTTTTASRPASTLPHHTSHLPTPSDRAAQLASFRASIAQDLASTVQPKVLVENRREEMILERRRDEEVRRRREAEKGAMEGFMEDRMRREGGWGDAHREVIRRMQGQADQAV